MRPFSLLSLLFYSACLGLCSYPVQADNTRPAYLGIDEFKPGVIRVVWKVPLNQQLPQRFRPSFPAAFKLTSRINRVKTPTAVVEKWTMVCGEQTLRGATIGISGLGETAMDALVRIQLTDGPPHRVVLRPTQLSTTVPDRPTNDQAGSGSLISERHLSNRWRYGLLFAAAWLLSLTSSARKRGILLCAAALVAGSVCGHALSRSSLIAPSSESKIISDSQAQRVLQGLLLNTYRAFILDNDEQVYDVLARSVDAEFINQVYLQNRETMRFDATEGAMGLVERLDVKTIESKKRSTGGGMEIVVVWDVYGSVRHWNHIHFRCNAYKAKVTIVPSDNYWKIKNIQLLDEERVI